SFVAIKGSFWCLHISDDGIERSVETYRSDSGFLTLFRTSLSPNGGMKGPRKVDRRHGHLTMDNPSHPREGGPVLKIGPEPVPSPQRKKRARARSCATGLGCRGRCSTIARRGRGPSNSIGRWWSWSGG